MKNLGELLILQQLGNFNGDLKMTKYHNDLDKMPQGYYFVFGSNESGSHGKGAALYAKQKLGARQGFAEGITGKCYALPTVGTWKNGKLQKMHFDTVQEYIKRFIEFTKKNPDKKFWITRVGCGLAGFSNAQIAPLFKCAVNQENLNFPIDWKEFLEDKQIKNLIDLKEKQQLGL